MSIEDNDDEFVDEKISKTKTSRIHLMLIAKIKIANKKNVVENNIIEKIEIEFKFKVSRAKKIKIDEENIKIVNYCNDKNVKKIVFEKNKKKRVITKIDALFFFFFFFCSNFFFFFFFFDRQKIHTNNKYLTNM